MYDDRPDIEPLGRAIQRLEEGLERYRSDTADLQIRDGLMHRFELTYDIGCKTVTRYLERAALNPTRFDEMPFQDQIRASNERGLLLGAWPDWRGYRRLRGLTIHSYREAIALEIVAHIPAFLEEVTYLRSRLREQLA